MGAFSSKSYSHSQLLKSKPFYRHYTFILWSSLYILWLSFELAAEDHFNDFSVIFLSIIGAIHLLTYLITYHWSTYIKSMVAFDKVKSITSASHIYLESLQAPIDIVNITKHTDDIGLTYYSFIHLEARFLCFDNCKFVKAKWPSCLNSFPHPGILEGNSAASWGILKRIFGANSLTIPIPSFLSLMKEHALAPFFVFQLVCILLWMLDTYWYHSLMTLVMLVIFEATVVFQRLKNLKEIRGMASPPQSCFLFRDGQWLPNQVSSEELIPGDIIGYTKDCVITSVPADMLILYGTCIVNEALLSGESTPCMKEHIEGPLSTLETELLNVGSTSLKKKFKNNFLFGGTKILQITTVHPTIEPETFPIPLQKFHFIALVVRTGFMTTQGKLVRTMCLGRERITANNAEAGYFLLFLLCFAIVAAVYVWIAAIAEDPERSRWRLLIQCLLIITSVVPPELPMELSMAVNASLLALSKLAIFCTEPFRLPMAGSVDLCCFDKTGTLTQSHLAVIGMSGIELPRSTTNTPGELIKDLSTVPGFSQFVIASCHSLIYLNNSVAGDPLEVAALNAVPWSLSTTTDKVMEKHGAVVRIVKRFAFLPSLKRMSVAIEVEQNSKAFTARPRDRYITCKGAPEAIHSLLIKAPEWYFSVAEHYAAEGCRVIALSYKLLETTRHIKELTRTYAESQLTFAGFLIFGSSMKKEAAHVIAQLANSEHRNVMITGDHALTAIHVASKLRMGGEHDSFLLVDTDPNRVSNSISIFDRKSKVDTLFSSPEDFKLWFEDNGTKISNLAITGPAFDLLVTWDLNWLALTLIRKILVFARFSPSNKEEVLRLFKNKLGWSTLMCGDGTNDVGALKQSHIGVALLDGTVEDLEKITKHHRALALKRRLDDMRRLGFSESQITKIQASSGASLTDDADDGNVPVLQFGDASVAAPFTSKIGTLESVCHILRQGRATLAATFQMYKILALNSLITAYSLSVLHNAGVRLGDFQLTISGLLLSSCFFFLSRSKPLSTLSKDRPPSTIFTKYSIFSIIGQFLIHCGALISLERLVRAYSPEKIPIHSEDFTFVPSLMNSSIYLLSLLMQVSTFAINYQGPPFRESISDNRGLVKSLTTVGLFTIICAAEFFPELNEFVQIVPFPAGFSIKLLFLMISDFLFSLAVELVSKKLFYRVTPKWTTTT